MEECRQSTGYSGIRTGEQETFCLSATRKHTYNQHVQPLGAQGHRGFGTTSVGTVGVTVGERWQKATLARCQVNLWELPDELGTPTKPYSIPGAREAWPCCCWEQRCLSVLCSPCLCAVVCTRSRYQLGLSPKCVLPQSCFPTQLMLRLQIF